MRRLLRSALGCCRGCIGMNGMDLPNSGPRSSNETGITSTVDGNEVIGIEAERVSYISEGADQETTTVAAIKTEPNVQRASVLISYKRRKHMCSETSLMAGNPTSINDLPDEIILQILSFVGPEDLALNIAKVCHRWNDLAKDITLWKTLSYTCWTVHEINDITEVLTVAPALHSLTLDCRWHVTDILEILFDKHVDLKKLILKKCHLGKNANGLLSNIVALYPDLEALSMLDCHEITSAGYCLISPLKKLSELNLSDCEELNGETVCHIVDSCQNLKKLSLGVMKWIGDGDLIHIINKLGKQLTSLALDGYLFTDVAYSYLNNCTRLRQLEIIRCDGMTDRGLLEGIGSLNKLISLCLNEGEGLTAKALSKFLHRPSMTSIVSLDLSKCTNLDDEGLKGIAERCIHLRTLNVFGCHKVTDAGISMVISHCNQLRNLHLRYMKNITGEGWLALLPSHLPHLRWLCLAMCDKVPYKHIAELMDAAPELEVTA